MIVISKENYESGDLLFIEDQILKKGFSLIIGIYDCYIITLNKVKNDTSLKQPKDFNTLSVINSFFNTKNLLLPEQTSTYY